MVNGHILFDDLFSCTMEGTYDKTVDRVEIELSEFFLNFNSRVVMNLLHNLNRGQ